MGPLKLFSITFFFFIIGARCYYEGGITGLKLINNKYMYMLIYINDGVQETNDFVDKVKATFTAASKYLYNATRKRALLGNVYIRIPNSWTKRQGYADALSLISQPKADILISPPHPTKRNFPFTRSYAGCGHPGIHIQLNTDFILKPGTLSSACTNPPVCGKPERFLVHEFATYRYGVFNEFPSPGEDPYYFSPLTGKLERVRCSLGQIGRLYQRVNGKYDVCSIDPDTGSYTDQCQYVAYPLHNVGTSSIMEYQWRQETIDFCDDKVTDIGAGKYGHNREPHTQQNRLCAHRSTWDVVTNTRDFVNNANPPTDSYTDPRFSVFRATSRKRRSVILSTTKDNRVAIHNALNRLLEEGKDDESDISIHTLDEYPDQELTHHIRTKHSAKIENGDFGSQRHVPDIIKTLTESRPNDTTVHALLILCGRERKLTTEDVQKLLLPDILPHVISCDGSGNEIESVVTDNDLFYKGGVFHEVHNFRPLVSLHHAMDTLSQITNADNNKPIQIVNEMVSVPAMSSRTLTFTLDEYLDGDLTLSLTFTSSVPTVILYSPEGRRFSSAYRGYSQDDILKILRILVPREEIKRGSWTYIIKNVDQDQINAHVTIGFKSINERSHYCITTRSWWKIFNDEKIPRIGIYTEVLQGHHSVSGMNVTAHVSQQDGKEHIISLFDNGAGADIEKDDGIYSRFFAHVYNSPGPYHVIVHVTNPGRDGHIVQKSILPQSSYLDLYGVAEFQYNISKIPLKFGLTRTTSAGSFKLPSNIHRRHFRSTTKSAQNTYPPSRMHDLRIIRRNVIDRTLVLQWTAPGNNLDNGKAHSYKLIYHHDINLLLDFPHKADTIPGRNILAGNTSDPLEAGSTETFTILMPQETKVIGIRLCARNGENRSSEFSNMVTVGFPEAEEGHYSPETQEGLSGYLSFAGLFIFLVGFHVILLFGLYIVRKNTYIKLEHDLNDMA